MATILEMRMGIGEAAATVTEAAQPTPLDMLSPEVLLLLAKVVEYSEETAVPLNECLSEALEDWLHCAAEPRLEAYRKKSLPSP